ncbi:MAG: alkaline phosphatase family protein [Opitutae bacterium]|nr:alkaline phosphatase family protein [Opitutae bacterium]
MKKLLACLFAAGLANAGGAQTHPAALAKPGRPIPAIKRVVIIGLDGLRPDRLLLADTPVLHGLMARGSYSMWMQTTALATTLPSFTSMLTGISPRKHAIYWDKLLPLTTPEWPTRPTLFELAKRAGCTTALIAGKAKFRHLHKPGTIDWFFAPTEDICSDESVTAEAIRAITALKPDVLFVHFPGIDTTGHRLGWGSPEQLVTINQVDTQVGRLLAALDHEGLLAGALIIVSSDHGGAGTSHGPEDPRSRTIPWIIAGPGVRPGYDLTQSAELMLRTEDTCATACYVLGLPVPDYFDGHPVTLAFAPAPAK